MKKTLLVFLFLIVFSSLAIANTEEDFAKAEEIIKFKTSCSQLTESQLELMGDYYMEQMHPGELHELMDERMGGEGSESLRQVHINMARSFYCGEYGSFSPGMMNIMMNRNSLGMMGRGNYGMMNSLGFYPFSSFTSFHSLLTIGLIILVIWLLLERSKGGRK